MTSTWCEESEKLVHDKDPDGHLMPLILYTDGVQVSTHARNKITPVMVTLGNFSDELLQKDCSKRVIAYLPNFKGNSKDNIKAHLMKTLSISKTAVRYHIFKDSCTSLMSYRRQLMFFPNLNFSLNEPYTTVSLNRL